MFLLKLPPLSFAFFNKSWASRSFCKTWYNVSQHSCCTWDNWVFWSVWIFGSPDFRCWNMWVEAGLSFPCVTTHFCKSHYYYWCALIVFLPLQQVKEKGCMVDWRFPPLNKISLPPILDEKSVVISHQHQTSGPIPAQRQPCYKTLADMKTSSLFFQDSDGTNSRQARATQSLEIFIVLTHLFQMLAKERASVKAKSFNRTKKSCGNSWFLLSAGIRISHLFHSVSSQYLSCYGFSLARLLGARCSCSVNLKDDCDVLKTPADQHGFVKPARSPPSKWLTSTFFTMSTWLNAHSYCHVICRGALCPDSQARRQTPNIKHVVSGM